MNDTRVVGLKPWLPEFLARSPHWTEPVRAERLAALRIGWGAVLLLDVLWLHLPNASNFFGGGSLGSPEVFAARLGSGWAWSLLPGVSDHHLWLAALTAWAIAAVCLLLGIFPRVAAGVAWALAISVQHANPYLLNSGDNVRQIVLLYLMLSPCGAAWSIASWWERRTQGDSRPAFIHPWPLRLLLVQMMAIYLVNGIYKLAGSDWRSGEMMYHVLANVQWTHFSYNQLPLPPGAVAAMTWSTLLWELSFPVLVMSPKLRAPTLWIGVLFHLGTAVLLTLSLFSLYMLCLYLPFVPWENWRLGASQTSDSLLVPRHAGIDLQAPGVNAAG